MENDNPSPETQQAIKDGINWLANWYKERCDAGVISSEEYESAIKKLQEVKIYTTKQGSNRITEELENGNLHFTPELQEKGATIDMWKDLMAAKNTFPLGWCARKQIKEPAIIIDIDKIKEQRGNDPKEISSVIIHELTHLTADCFHANHDVKKIMCGEDINIEAKKAYNLSHNKSVENITINPNIIADTNTPLVVPKVDNSKTLLAGNTDETYGFMNDGVSYNKYLDANNEIYARIMQFRYENGLQADDLISNEDLKKMENDRNVIDRYKPQVISSILNDIAVVPNLKNQMKKDLEDAQLYMSNMEEKYFANNTKASTQQKNSNIPLDLIAAKSRDTYSA